ncbi:MAG: hypothetical protein IKF64_01330 [Eubacterium sp.]|nr:hypothetical protein [Eubacterium sp.]
MKKLISVFLAAVMLVSVLSVGTSVFAETMYSATAVSFGNTYTGTLANNNEDDWYKLTVSSSGRVTMNTTNYNNEANAIYELFNANGDELKYYDFDYNSALGYAAGTANMYLSAGTYYLKATTNEWEDRNGYYSISFSYTNAQESFFEDTNDANRYISGANAISLGQTYKGQLGIGDTTDFYSFSLSGDSTIILTGTSYNNQANAIFELYDSTGNYLQYYDFDYNSQLGYAAGTKNISLKKGTYYICTTTYEWEDRVGFYNFSVSLKQNPTPTPTPAPAPTSTAKPTVSLKKVTVKKKAKKLVLQATVKVNGVAVKGKKVTFKFNGKKYTAKTNSNGVAKVTIKKAVLKKLKKGKKITYSATYGGVTAKKTAKVK